MKKFIISVFLIVAVIVTKQLSSYKGNVSSLLLYNIEALAADEGGGPYNCVGVGSIDCPLSHYKVKYVFSGYRLEE